MCSAIIAVAAFVFITPSCYDRAWYWMIVGWLLVCFISSVLVELDKKR